jgi:hypothetical protein
LEEDRSVPDELPEVDDPPPELDPAVESPAALATDWDGSFLVPDADWTV